MDVREFKNADVAYLDAKDEQLKVVRDRFWPLDQAELVRFYKTKEDRVKTRIAGDTASSWWLRTPTTGYAHNLYIVNTTGTALSINAYYSIGIGFSPACVIG